ncbi:hypothetical protein K466DRAFT_604271 [Polyporus arcularius HHB13444]|uniref:Uncharacterized protein n=1 Tax=Polyporus arcularius HHB13444 TaxID=1314778 RepID=A0A5C3NW87_9APHY|nr:hypothetical protein K466DRAFT_604271 [Polyporus arcularius HHB13444]
MISHFPSPILSVAADAVKDLEGEDALYGLWALFTKCKESLKDGRRLENISWRLWYREMAFSQTTPSSSPGSLSPSFSEKRSPSPITPISEDGLVTPQVPLPHPSLSPANDVATAYSWHVQHSATTVMTAGRRLSTASAPMERGKPQTSACVGKMILDILPCKLDVEGEIAARSPTIPRIVQPRPIVATLPTVQLPSTPPPTNGSSFPRVVVVNPTPHPTPPATPSNSDPPSTAAQPSSHLLPPLPARSFVSSTLVAPPASSAKQPSPPRVVSLLQPKPPVATSLLTSMKPVSHDAVPAAPSKSKHYNDDTLKASDRRFFLQDAGSPSPDADRIDTEAPSENGDQAQEPDAHSPSSGTSSQMKSELTGHTSAVGGAAKRSRVLQVRKTKDRHIPVRPAFQRMQSHGARQTAQKKAVVADTKKTTTFNIGSASSNGSRSGKSTAADKEKEKKTELSRMRTASPAPPAAAKPPSTQANTSANATASTNGAGPSQQRRGIVITTSSEYETDSDDDSDWASEDSADDPEKERKKKKAAEEARRREEEEQRERDMFSKQPKRSYSNLGNRTKSGLLSQLLNPDPNLFPPNHPYRNSRSTQDMTQFARQAAASPMLPTSRSSVAVPLAAQVAPVTVQAAVQPPADNARQGAYRPRGRPQEAELEDTESDEENPDDTIQVSHSLAQQKLAALAGRRHSDHGPGQQQKQPPSGLQQQRQQMQQAGGGAGAGGRPQLPSVATAPIPLSHPYNLPAPAPPMTPRTTRRQMLQTELSESLRRNLLWERQVSRINVTARRGGGVLGSGLRPLTAMPGDGAQQQQQAGAPPAGQQQQQQQQQQRGPDEQAQNGGDREERTRRAMARNRSWADEYHYSGW